jgi:hypothetical protein
MPHPADDVGEVSSGVRQGDLQSRQTIKYPAENEMPRGEGRIQGVPDQVGEVAIFHPFLVPSESDSAKPLGRNEATLAKLISHIFRFESS